MLIDLIVISIIIPPIMIILSKYIFMGIFNTFSYKESLSAGQGSIYTSISTAEFANHVTPTSFLFYLLTLLILNSTLPGIYFVFFWRKFNATPGKLFLRMKVVDADNFSTPSISNLIKRYIAYLTAFFGMWSIIFNNRKMAFHDKIANTVVIKS